MNLVEHRSRNGVLLLCLSVFQAADQFSNPGTVMLHCKNDCQTPAPPQSSLA